MRRRRTACPLALAVVIAVVVPAACTTWDAAPLGDAAAPPGSASQPAAASGSGPAMPPGVKPGSSPRRRPAPTISPMPASPRSSTVVSSSGDDPAACLARWPTPLVAAQLVWPAVYGDQLESQAPTFAGWGVGGALLMTWPDAATPEQLLAFKDAAKVPLLIATDEEGGDVQRFRRLGALPAQGQVAATMPVEDARRMVADHAAAMHRVGVDVVFGPVADVGPADGSDGPMGDRVFSTDPQVVADYTAAYVRGWQRGGILPVLKHFPGHGSASADTHVAVARTPPLEELARRDLVPYRRLAGEDVGVMVGHLDVPGLTEDGGGPASLSPAAITDLLRDQLGFAGHLVVTDALDMQAVAARAMLPAAAEQAVAAGADVVVYADTAATPQVIARLVDAESAGRLPPGRLHQAARQVLATKGVDPCDVTA